MPRCNGSEVSTGEQEGVVLPLEGEGVGDCPKEDKEGVETDRVPGCYGEYDPVKYWCKGCETETECLKISNKINSKETVDDLEVSSKMHCEKCGDSVNACARKDGLLLCEDCFNEAEDDLEGLVEPEPVWNSVCTGEQIVPDTKKLIENRWMNVKSSLTTLLMIYHRQADEEFSAKLGEVLGEIK